MGKQPWKRQTQLFFSSKTQLSGPDLRCAVKELGSIRLAPYTFRQLLSTILYLLYLSSKPLHRPLSVALQP